jgi:esterase/lipase superfamily enzyme
VLRAVRYALLAVAALLLAAAGGAVLALRLSLPPPSNLRNVQFPFAVGEETGMPVVELFYATNRQPATVPGRFGDAPAPVLRYGRAHLRIPAGFRIDDAQIPELPRGVIDERRISVLSVEPLDEPTFFAAIRERLAAGAVAVNLAVQGIHNSFDSTLRQAAAFEVSLNQRQVTIAFAWPTSSSLLDYRTDEARVPAAAAAFASFLRAIEAQLGQARLDVIAHSLGCRVVCDAFGALIRDPAFKDSDPELANVVFAAPDVARRHFDALVEIAAALARRVTVYVARNDGVLVFASLLDGDPSAGDEAAKEIARTFRAEAAELSHIQVVDATFVNASQSRHSYYYQSRAVFDDIADLLRHDLPAERRHLRSHDAAGRSNYWVIPP